mgnify:CR=1 FL=1|jgi:hypothetical protein
MQDMTVKSAFVAMNVKTGKTVMQFELDPEDIGMMPELAKAVGELVVLDVHRGQAEHPPDDAIGKIHGTSLVDRETGEALATVD